MSSSTSVVGQQPPPVPISLQYVFGLKGDVKNNIHYIDDSTVLYPAGYSVVIYNTEKKTQKFISLGSTDYVSSCDVSALTLLNSATAPNYSHSSTSNTAALSTLNKSTCLLAVAERGDRQSATVTVMDLQSVKKSRYLIQSSDVISPEYVSVAFSADGKYLLTQGGAPDWSLVNWNWEKGQVLQTARVSNQAGAAINQVSFCPVDSSVVCVTGNGVLRFLHAEESEFKAIPVNMGSRRETQNYTCHCWVEERVLVGTDTGDVLLYENAEFVGVLESSPSDGKSIDCIVPFSKGFVIGCDEGVIYIYVCDEHEYYKLTKSFQIENNYVRIKSLSISPSEDNVVCTLENNQSFVLNLGLGSGSSSIMHSDDFGLMPLVPPSHFQAILDMDLCVRKPLLLTCGLDRSVRIWNYLTHTLEVLQFFSEQPLSVAFHPAGLQLIVSFADAVRIFSLLLDELRCIHELPIKACREVRFAHGGQYFAVANGSVVQIYSFFTCELLGSFTSHRGRIKTIDWAADDSAITTAGVDGQMFTFKIVPSALTLANNNISNVKDFPLLQTFKLPRGQLTSAVASLESRPMIYVAAGDRHLRVVHDNDCVLDQQHNLTLTQLAITPPILTNTNTPTLGPDANNANKYSVLFAGTDVGVLRCFALPLTDYCYDVQCHSAPITRVLLSQAYTHLFTCSEDGSLCVFEIKQTVENAAATGSTTATRTEHMPQPGLGLAPGLGMTWSEEVLVSGADLAEKKMKIQDLQHRVERMLLDNEAQAQHKEQLHTEKRKEIEEKFQTELEMGNGKLKELDDERRKAESWFAYRVEQLSQHHQEKLNAQAALYDDKVAAEAARCVEADQKLAYEQEEANIRHTAFVDKSAEEKKRLQQEYAELIRKEKELRISIVVETQKKSTEYAQLKQMIEDDADKEIDDIKSSFDSKFSKERNNTLKLRDSNSLHQKKFRELRDLVSTKLSELKAMKAHQERLYTDMTELGQDIHINVKELRERDTTVQDKLERLSQLKKKSQELEKFKFVLDCKLAELKRQLEPRRLEMESLRSQVVHMQRELGQYDKTSQSLELQVQRLVMKHDGLDKELIKAKMLKDLVLQRVKAFKNSIQEVLGSVVTAIARITNDMQSGAPVTVAKNVVHAVAGDVEAALGAVAHNSIHNQELATVTKQIKHGLRHIYQQHVLNVQEDSFIQDSLDNLAYKNTSLANPGQQKNNSKTQPVQISLFGKSNKAWVSGLISTKSANNLSSTVNAGRSVSGSSRTVQDLHSEYERQRQYLEKSVDSLVAKSQKASQMHQDEQKRILHENVVLIKEINLLRRELQMTRVIHRHKEQTANNHNNNNHTVAVASSATGGEKRRAAEREIEMQQEQIRALKNHLMVLEAQEAKSNI